MSGLIFAVILIPINRWLANQISSLSTQLLEARDSRVSQMCEALSGAKQIKILAWEDVFIDRIQSIHFYLKICSQIYLLNLWHFYRVHGRCTPA